MAGLCWVAVMLAFSLSADNSLAAVDQNRLARFVKGIKREYGTPGMFSLAVNIPEDQNQNTDQILQKVFTSDPADEVKEEINNNRIYTGTRVVAAKFLKDESGKTLKHAEFRVLEKLEILNKQENGMLLFYVISSPCKQCAGINNKNSELSIVKRLNAITKWKDNYAVVFSNVLQSYTGIDINPDVRRDILVKLGTFEEEGAKAIGLENIYRCDIQCTSCFHSQSPKSVTSYCVDENSPVERQPSNTNADSGQSGSRTGGGAAGGAGATGKGGGAVGGAGATGKGGGAVGGAGATGKGGGAVGGAGATGKGGGAVGGAGKKTYAEAAQKNSGK